ncbi:MAG: HAMP domain-containing sensor histidine kinase [Candidatus Microsaccharimonas sp.]
MTAIVLRGSLIVTISLTILLTFHGLSTGNLLASRVFDCLGVILYLLLGEFLIRKQRYILVGWLIMSLYIFLSILTLLLWGVNAPMGILSVGFVIFLSGLLLGPHHIAWVIGGITTLLFLVQYVHRAGYIHPELEALAKPSDYFDILAYVTIFSIFALLSWLSSKQTEYSLNRALSAEEKLRAEKDNLVIKLAEQSRQLHQAQLEEILRLYKFAEMGQSTTATLHELSNLLSELTLDIDDIGQQHQTSQAITHTKEVVDRINRLVRQTRKQLQGNQTSEVFNAIPVIQQTIQELQLKFDAKAVILVKTFSQQKTFKILGDPLNLSHIVTILLNNALDACLTQPHSRVEIIVKQVKNRLIISVIDNGPGIPENQQRRLFSPHESSKPSGLGIGLYITKHIIESQFRGKISLSPTQSAGATFVVELPKYENLRN